MKSTVFSLGKLALKHSGTDLDAMRAIANAAKKRSLADFNQVGVFFVASVHLLF